MPWSKGTPVAALFFWNGGVSKSRIPKVLGLYLQNQPLVWDSLRIWVGWSLVTSFNVYRIPIWPYKESCKKKNHLPFGCLVCFGERIDTAGCQLKKMTNQVDPIDRTYKGSRPLKEALCFTCRFQMFNPVLHEIWNVNVTSLILS